LRPPALAAFNLALEIAVEHQIGQFAVLVEGLLDLAQEAAANDAAAPPHQSDAAVIEVPLVFLGPRRA